MLYKLLTVSKITQEDAYLVMVPISSCSTFGVVECEVVSVQSGSETEPEQSHWCCFAVLLGLYSSATSRSWWELQPRNVKYNITGCVAKRGSDGFQARSHRLVLGYLLVLSTALHQEMFHHKNGAHGLMVPHVRRSAESCDRAWATINWAWWFVIVCLCCLTDLGRNLQNGVHVQRCGK